MELDQDKLTQAVRRLLAIEHDHIYGAQTGSDSARVKRIENELNRLLDDLSSAKTGDHA